MCSGGGGGGGIQHAHPERPVDSLPPSGAYATAYMGVIPGAPKVLTHV